MSNTHGFHAAGYGQSLTWITLPPFQSYLARHDITALMPGVICHRSHLLMDRQGERGSDPREFGYLHPGLLLLAERTDARRQHEGWTEALKAREQRPCRLL